MLGEGLYQCVIADRGGSTRIGPLSDLFNLVIDFRRDDTGQATASVGVTDGTSDFLADLRTGRHEMVVYRNGARVFEGPITRLNYQRETVDITARDITWYMSRRALEYNYDNRFPNVQTATTVLKAMLQQHYPTSGDPYNIGQYIKVIQLADDARTASLHAAYTKTVWEMLDQMAQTGGVDYVVRGRSLIVADTNTRLNVTQRMTDESFASDLQVVEYGSELATRTFSTNNQGSVAGAVAPQRWLDYYGSIDEIINNDVEDGDPTTPTDILQEQASRALSRSYPAPVDILVPARSLVVPGVSQDFMELMPGSWVPVQTTIGPRKVLQFQRIDLTQAVFNLGKEEVRVSMSAAPTEFSDPV